MIVLDTNVVSALIQTTPDPVVVSWLNLQQSDLVWTTAVSVFEIRFGLSVMPAGRRQQALLASFDQALIQMGNRVHPFDSAAAAQAASVSGRLRSIGRPIEFRDVMIAGTVAAHGATLITRNTKHFADTGVPLINPWQTASP
jgi:hypothetical protein